MLVVFNEILFGFTLEEVLEELLSLLEVLLLFDEFEFVFLELLSFFFVFSFGSSFKTVTVIFPSFASSSVLTVISASPALSAVTMPSSSTSIISSSLVLFH